MSQSLKVLMIGSDRNLFKDGSAVSVRIKEYGALVKELHIVIFAKHSLGFKEKQLASNIWVYPTNSLFKWLYLRDASIIGKKIVYIKNFVRGESLITAQDPFESGWVGLKIKRKWRIPLEVQMHTDPFSPYFRGVQNTVRKILAKKVLRNADSVRVVSEYLKGKILHLTKAPIRVLPIYIDKDRVENRKISFDLHALYPWHFIILMVSRLTPEKNIPLALQALSIVRERYNDAGLLLVGSGPEKERIENEIKKLNLEGAVAFAGWQEELSSFYKTANVFLQTSLFEGYGMSLVEAGLSQLPVITTPVGIAMELENGKDAYIYPAENADRFADGIIDLLENIQKRESLRLNMKRTLEKRLISQEEYLKEMALGWENTATHIV